MNLNTYRILPAGWSEPEIPDLAGPADLAGVLAHFRRLAREDDTPIAAISDDGLHRLLRVVFAASVMPEEGRFPRWRITTLPCRGLLEVASLVSPIPLDDIQPLRRLAPICRNRDSALSIEETDHGLVCNGLVNVGPRGHDTIPGRPEFVKIGRAVTLDVEVLGPGHLVASETVTYELRAGRIRQVVPVQAVPAVREWLREAGKSLHAKIAAKEPTAQKYFGGPSGVSALVEKVVSDALRIAVHERHGGTIVLLPVAASPAAFDIHCNYDSLGPDLGGNIVDFWTSCFEAHQAKSDSKRENDHGLRQWLSQREMFLHNIEALADLSSIDGCVVIDRDLLVVGWGAEIRIDPMDNRLGNRSFKRLKTEELIDAKEFLNAIGGTRHRSAARLCLCHKDAIAIVVSQDGEIRLFLTDPFDGHACGFGPMAANFGGA